MLTKVILPLRGRRGDTFIYWNTVDDQSSRREANPSSLSSLSMPRGGSGLLDLPAILVAFPDGGKIAPLQKEQLTKRCIFGSFQKATRRGVCNQSTLFHCPETCPTTPAALPSSGQRTKQLWDPQRDVYVDHTPSGRTL